MFVQWVCNYHGNTSVYLPNNATQAATNIHEAHLVRDSPVVKYIIPVSFTFKNRNAKPPAELITLEFPYNFSIKVPNLFKWPYTIEFTENFESFV
jgi:hypothetical protein